MSVKAKVSDNSLLPTLLTVLFVGLKLTHYIDWSWCWVLSPLWIPLAFVCAVWAVFLVVAGFVALVKAIP